MVYFIKIKESFMAEIILLEIEEDIRLAAQILAKRRNIIIDVYADYQNYERYKKDSHKVCSSSKEECSKYGFHYIQKPYTADELLSLLDKVR